MALGKTNPTSVHNDTDNLLKHPYIVMQNSHYLDWVDELLSIPGKQAILLEDEGFGLDSEASKLLLRLYSTSYKVQQGFKRALDIVAALTGLIILAPFLLLIALLVKATSPGPVLYKSQRIGKNGLPFDMYKFRTMSDNADALRAQLRVENEQHTELFKLKNDPRITPIGNILRTFSLDEFPQLLNVLKGDMSLVGPRPFAPDDSALFKAPYTLRFMVTPGITGLWQVSGRSQLTFQKMCELEMQYIQEWSLLQDFKILFKTFPAVLAARGAY